MNPQPEQETIRIPIQKANLISKDLKLLSNVRDQLKTATELTEELRSKFQLAEEVIASKEIRIKILESQIEIYQKNEKTTFAKVIKDIGKVLVGVLVGTLTTLVLTAG